MYDLKQDGQLLAGKVSLSFLPLFFFFGYKDVLTNIGYYCFRCWCKVNSSGNTGCWVTQTIFRAARKCSKVKEICYGAKYQNGFDEADFSTSTAGIWFQPISIFTKYHQILFQLFCCDELMVSSLKSEKKWLPNYSLSLFISWDGWVVFIC